MRAAIFIAVCMLCGWLVVGSTAMEVSQIQQQRAALQDSIHRAADRVIPLQDEGEPHLTGLTDFLDLSQPAGFDLDPSATPDEETEAKADAAAAAAEEMEKKPEEATAPEETAASAEEGTESAEEEGTESAEEQPEEDEAAEKDAESTEAEEEAAEEKPAEDAAAVQEESDGSEESAAESDGEDPAQEAESASKDGAEAEAEEQSEEESSEPESKAPANSKTRQDAMASAKSILGLLTQKKDLISERHQVRVKRLQEKAATKQAEETGSWIPGGKKNADAEESAEEFVDQDENMAVSIKAQQEAAEALNNKLATLDGTAAQVDDPMVAMVGKVAAEAAGAAGFNQSRTEDQASASVNATQKVLDADKEADKVMADAENFEGNLTMEANKKIKEEKKEAKATLAAANAKMKKAEEKAGNATQLEAAAAKQKQDADDEVEKLETEKELKNQTESEAMRKTELGPESSTKLKVATAKHLKAMKKSHKKVLQLYQKMAKMEEAVVNGKKVTPLEKQQLDEMSQSAKKLVNAADAAGADANAPGASSKPDTALEEKAETAGTAEAVVAKAEEDEKKVSKMEGKLKNMRDGPDKEELKQKVMSMKSETKKKKKQAQAMQAISDGETLTTATQEKKDELAVDYKTVNAEKAKEREIENAKAEVSKEKARTVEKVEAAKRTLEVEKEKAKAKDVKIAVLKAELKAAEQVDQNDKEFEEKKEALDDTAKDNPEAALEQADKMKQEAEDAEDDQLPVEERLKKVAKMSDDEKKQHKLKLLDDNRTHQDLLDKFAKIKKMSPEDKEKRAEEVADKIEDHKNTVGKFEKTKKDLDAEKDGKSESDEPETEKKELEKSEDESDKPKTKLDKEYEKALNGADKTPELPMPKSQIAAEAKEATMTDRLAKVELMSKEEKTAHANKLIEQSKSHQSLLDEFEKTSNDRKKVEAKGAGHQGGGSGGGNSVLGA